ncbi:CD63 antigen [Oryzias latipes]|uniref:Tetraspanin n=2 Tax=Oryzias latipes TaxID=8090 RepID=H2MK80_ORYLA|nr:CD63 antigen [Oryzias latipes]
MGVEGAMKCVKFSLVFFNFICWLCGLALVVVGIMVQVSLHNTLKIKDVSMSGIPIVIIAVGALIFFIAFFGCCGAWKEHYCMVTTFAVLLTLIIIIEIAAAIAGFVFRNKISPIVNEGLTKMIENYKNGTDDFKATVDQIQENLKCCGVNSSSDWSYLDSDGNSVPDSCCINKTKGCGKGSMKNAGTVYQKGCHDVIENLLKTNIQWVIVAAIVIALVQILGVVFSCLLMKSIRSGYEVM